MRNAPIRPDGTCVTAQQLRVRGLALDDPPAALPNTFRHCQVEADLARRSTATTAAEVIGVLLQSSPPLPPHPAY